MSTTTQTATLVKDTVADDKRRTAKKNGDIPFAYVYFGFLALYFLFFGERFWRSLPTRDEVVNSTIVPELETAKLPLFAIFVVCPALWAWRKLVKEMTLSYIATHWAGLTPDTFKHEKFCEQGWLAVHYSIVTILGLVVLQNKPWFPPLLTEDARMALLATREDREADHLDTGFRIWYATQLGFYTLELATLLLTSKRGRSDAMVYFLHHIYTTYLLAGSWVSYQHRIGSLVLLLHDVGDIFLPVGKCYTYAEEHIRRTRSKGQYEMHKMVGMGFFIMFVIAFAIPRLIIFGALVFQGFDDLYQFKCCGFDRVTKTCGTCWGAKGAKWDTPLVAVLGLLYPMHVYWFYLIVKMAVKLLFQPNEYGDVRSDEDEKDD